MAYDVFISYSSKDKAVADAVCATLERRKIRCWIAPRDIPPGKPYAASLVNAISESRVFVLVLSEGSNQSSHVLREVGEAVDNGIPVLPLRIEEVEPSQEMRYYIKSIHWLDAMTPPMEQHLEKLAGSVQALLDVGEEPQEEPQTTGVETIIEAPAQKRRMMPVWSMILLALTAVIILGGVGWWLVAQISPKPTDEITSSMVATPTDTSNLETTPTLINIIANTSTPGPSSSTGWTDWRPVSFVIPNPQIWEESGDNRYTAVGQREVDAFAWSTETFEGDLMVSLDLESSENQSSGCVIIYGDGQEYSYGSLIFCVDWDGHFLEKHTIYYEGEDNYLTHSPTNVELKDKVHSVTIEIKDDIASMYANGEKVFSSFFDTEEIDRRGRIGLLKKWFDPEITFSNIQIKTPGDGD